MDYSITNPKNFLTTPWRYPLRFYFTHGNIVGAIHESPPCSRCKK